MKDSVIEAALAQLRHDAHLAITPTEAIAEVKRWRSIAENHLGTINPDEVEDYLVLSGLSIHLCDYGEWGRDTLECLFAELGIQPGDDFEQAIEHVRANLA